jgi:hypothetical protein
VAAGLAVALLLLRGRPRPRLGSEDSFVATPSPSGEEAGWDIVGDAGEVFILRGAGVAATTFCLPPDFERGTDLDAGSFFCAGAAALGAGRAGTVLLFGFPFAAFAVAFFTIRFAAGLVFAETLVLAGTVVRLAGLDLRAMCEERW